MNGDQSGKGYSKYSYRPFTLEGNFAFAAGLQEMLIQSHTGIIHIFPALPNDWKDVRFHQLRTEGAFLVSATMESGSLINVNIKSEKGGVLKIKNSFQKGEFNSSVKYEINDNGVIVIDTDISDSINLTLKI